MAATLEHDILRSGHWQADVVKYLENIRDVVNELQTDHATYRTEVVAIGTTLASVKALYDAHVHTADGNASRTSIPDSGSATGSPSAASVIADTSGSSVPAALTNSTALKLTKG